MGSKNTQDSPWTWHNVPSQKVRPHTVETSKGEGRERTKEEAQEEDGHPGGGQQTESKEVAKEGGASEETGGAQSRRSTAGPRPHPWWWPMVEPTEGGAMEEVWPPRGRPTAAEQVVVEPEAEMESQLARWMQMILGGLGGAKGSGDRGGDPEIRGGAGVTEDPCGADGRKEHFRGAGTGGHIRGADTGGPEAPSMSSSPRCIISSPSAAVQGVELHSALTLSTACSLVVGTVAGSRT